MKRTALARICINVSSGTSARVLPMVGDALSFNIDNSGARPTMSSLFARGTKFRAT